MKIEDCTPQSVIIINGTEYQFTGMRKKEKGKDFYVVMNIPRKEILKIQKGTDVYVKGKI